MHSNSRNKIGFQYQLSGGKDFLLNFFNTLTSDAGQSIDLSISHSLVFVMLTGSNTFPTSN